MLLPAVDLALRLDGFDLVVYPRVVLKPLVIGPVGALLPDAIGGVELGELDCLPPSLWDWALVALGDPYLVETKFLNVAIAHSSCSPSP